MNALEISGLKKTYQGGVEALKGIDLTVKQGDFFALLGPNLSGQVHHHRRHQLAGEQEWRQGEGIRL